MENFSSANKAEFLIPKNQSEYLGVVVERFEDNVDDTSDAPRNYKIKFNILGLPEFTDEHPIAILLGNSTRPVEIDEIVRIHDICNLATGMHVFLYEPIFEDRFTGIKNYYNEINMTKKNVTHIKLPNIEITADGNEGSNDDDNQDDLDDTKGSVKVKLPGCEIEYSNDDEKITTTITFDEDITIEKTVTKTFKDSVTETFEKDVTRTYKDAVKETYEKQVDIDQKDAVNQKIGKDFKQEVSGNINVKSDKEVKMESGTNITIKSGASMTIESTAAMTIKSGAPMDIKATGMVKVNATPAVGWCSMPACAFTGAPHTTGSCPTA